MCDAKSTNVLEHNTEELPSPSTYTTQHLNAASVLASLAAGSYSATNEVDADSSQRQQRLRRHVSPKPIATLLENMAEPISPMSSSTDQTSSGDATFEPTIEMMLDEFDDEQTLNEEEALAAEESQNPQDEIDTLQKESEMPIEELLAKYGASVPTSTATNGATSRKRKARAEKKKQQKHAEAGGSKDLEEEVAAAILTKLREAVIVIDSADEDNTDAIEQQAMDELQRAAAETEETLEENQELADEEPVVERHTMRRSRLLDLYPENFSGLANGITELEDIYDVDEEDEYEDEEEEEPPQQPQQKGSEKKYILVGSQHQAVIPSGLSKYGDVLPYENKDKLIWEPSQVSEEEVEEYLQKMREIKGYSSDKHPVVENGYAAADKTATQQTDMETGSNSDFNANAENKLKTEEKQLSGSEGHKIVKDDEQALHLLVQCGYDFNEALRRKRLNAVPLTGAMSIWSEEECRKFEEGIQKFGKDFFKIRQQLVRTRSIRELVQFYYQWKKSERRDHELADSDTVDHMDMYLNERDYGSNTLPGCPANAIGGVAMAAAVQAAQLRTSNSKSYSIMTSSNGSSSSSSGAAYLSLAANVPTTSNQARTRLGDADAAELPQTSTSAAKKSS